MIFIPFIRCLEVLCVSCCLGCLLYLEGLAAPRRFTSWHVSYSHALCGYEKSFYGSFRPEGSASFRIECFWLGFKDPEFTASCQAMQQKIPQPCKLWRNPFKLLCIDIYIYIYVYFLFIYIYILIYLYV